MTVTGEGAVGRHGDQGQSEVQWKFSPLLQLPVDCLVVLRFGEFFFSSPNYIYTTILPGLKETGKKKRFTPPCDAEIIQELFFFCEKIRVYIAAVAAKCLFVASVTVLLFVLSHISTLFLSNDIKSKC